MREDGDAGPEAAHQLARLVELEDDRQRRHRRLGAVVAAVGAAALGHPDRLAVGIDVDGAGRAPRAALGQLEVVLDRGVRIRRLVDRACWPTVRPDRTSPRSITPARRQPAPGKGPLCHGAPRKKAILAARGLHAAAYSNRRPAAAGHAPIQMDRGSRGQLPEIGAVLAAAHRRRQAAQVLGVDVAEPEGHFLGTGHPQPLPLLDGLDEGGGLEQRFRRAGVEPGGAAAQDLDPQRARGEVDLVEIGDLQLAARRRLEVARVVADLAIVEVEAGHGVGRPRRLGLLFEAHRRALRVELDHAVALGVAHAIGEHGGAVGVAGGAAQIVGQPGAVEEVVAQRQRGAFPFMNSRPMMNAWASPSGDGCTAYDSSIPHCRPSRSTPLERRRVVRGGDDQDLRAARPSSAWSAGSRSSACRRPARAAC